LRSFGIFVAGVFLVAATIVAVVNVATRELRRLSAQVDALQAERSQLVQYVERLNASRRAAQLEVLRERTDDQGRPVLTLLWQEIGPDGLLGQPVACEAIGRQVYVEARVLKFQPQHVAEGDPARGSSLALFRRVFGERQAPETGAELDRAARPAGDRPREIDALHDRLWSRFFDFIDDAKLAEQYGVRVAQIEAPAAPMQAGQIWEVTLDASGGLNLRKLGVREQP
jgi:hypothetical protein